MPNRVSSSHVPSNRVSSDRILPTVPTSKGVQDRILQSRSVILAGYLYAEVAALAWGRRLNDFLFRLASNGQWGRLGECLAATPESDASLDTLFRNIARDIEELGEAMVDADANLARCRVELRRAQQHRDRRAKLVYRELSQTRRIFKLLLGHQPACDLLGLKGPTPRDPESLLHWARSAIAVLSDPKLWVGVVVDDSSLLKTLEVKPHELAERLASVCEPLRQAIQAAITAYWAEGIALEAQRQAIASFDRDHLRGARVLEAVLDILGLPTLASTVRPSVKRRGRPPKQQPVDAHPDLVERVLGDGNAEPERDDDPAVAAIQAAGSLHEESKATKRVTAANDDPAIGEKAVPAVKVGQRKVEKASRKLIFGDLKIGRGVRKLSGGNQKSERGVRKQVVGVRKSGNQPRKRIERSSSRLFGRVMASMGGALRFLGSESGKNEHLLHGDESFDRMSPGDAPPSSRIGELRRGQLR